MYMHGVCTVYARYVRTCSSVERRATGDRAAAAAAAASAAASAPSAPTTLAACASAAASANFALRLESREP